MDAKVCRVCGEILQLTEENFYPQGGGRVGLRGECKRCYRVLQLEYYSKNIDAIRKRGADYRLRNAEQIKEKAQSKREERREKAREYYYKNKEQIKERNKKTKARKKLRRLERVFDIKEDFIVELMNDQRGCCKICGDSLTTPESSLSYCVDHDHNTGEIRGLLCLLCNSLLGFARDNKDILRSAINYL